MNLRCIVTEEGRESFCTVFEKWSLLVAVWVEMVLPGKVSGLIFDNSAE